MRPQRCVQKMIDHLNDRTETVFGKKFFVAQKFKRDTKKKMKFTFFFSVVMILCHLLEKYTNNAVERYYRYNDEYGDYWTTGNGRVWAFFDVYRSTQNLVGRGGGAGGLQGIEQASLREQLLFLFSPSTSQLNLAPPQPITHRKHFSITSLRLNTIPSFKNKCSFSFRFRVAKTIDSREKKIIMLNEKETRRKWIFVFKKLFGRPDNRWVGVGWWWTRPVKELRWVCSREKGGGTKWDQQESSQYPFFPIRPTKKGEKGVSQLLFFSLSFFFIFSPIERGRPILSSRCSHKATQPPLITLPTPP